MEKFYKVLVNGKSCHGGSFEWSLPDAFAPGDWHEFTGQLQICHSGFHLTSEPARWWKHDADCFEVEFDGEIIRGIDTGDDADKVCVRKVRLVRKLDDAELIALNVFRAGVHQADAGKYAAAYGNATVRADGNATVRAYGNATVRADGNATVRADGNATVEAYGNATVEAYGNATVEAYGNATVRADGNATVRAYGNATVRADGNATVRAYGNATVEAYGNATVHQYQTYRKNSSNVSLAGSAVCIDRRSGKPVIQVVKED